MPVSYTLFFIVVFCIFLFVTFPGEAIKNRIVNEISRNSHYLTEIERASISPVNNINMDRVMVYKSRHRVLDFDSVSIKIPILGLFSETPKIPFIAKKGDGVIRGYVRVNKNTGDISEISAKLESVRIDSLPAFLTRLDGEQELVQLQGVMDGELHVDVAPVPDGEFHFVINAIHVDNLKFNEMALPALSGLTAQVTGTIEENATNIEQFNVRGEGLDFPASGKAPLLWELSRGGGLLDLEYRFEVNGGQLAKFMPFLSGSPYLAKQRDGSLGGKVLGTVKNPQFEKSSVKRF